MKTVAKDNMTILEKYTAYAKIFNGLCPKKKEVPKKMDWGTKI